MNGAVFVDTNVLIYAVDNRDPQKQNAARRWRDAVALSRRGRISFQVLQEFYWKMRKLQPAASDKARADVRDLLAWRPVVLDESVLAQAWNIEDRYQLSFWDALIVAAAQAASCRYLLTEDLQHGQNLDGVQVISPFLSSPEAVLKN